MSKLFQKLTSALICTALVASLMAGCSSKKEEENPANATGSAEPAKTEQPSGPVTYPIKTDVTLTYWVGLNTNVSTTSATLNETEFAKQLEKQTGIKVKYIHPTLGQNKEQFNLMLASKDLPDIIEYEWLSFVGGPELAIKDGYIIKLNDVIEKNAPNLKKHLDENAEIAKKAKTDNANYFMFPFIRGDSKLLVFHGPMLRNDWLKELNLQVPTTIDEWTNVLSAFKEKKGATAPLSFQKEANPKIGTLVWGTFVGAYGMPRDYFMDNGKIKYGPIEPGFKDFLALFSKWYADGLLDKNFATVDAKILDANITSGKSGAAVGYNGGGLGKWMQAMKSKEPNFELIAAPYPTLKKGETPGFGQLDNKVQGIGGAITTKCKNVEIAARLLDYGYSE